MDDKRFFTTFVDIYHYTDVFILDCAKSWLLIFDAASFLLGYRNIFVAQAHSNASFKISQREMKLGLEDEWQY